MVANIKAHTKGTLKDGRPFEIIDFDTFAFSDDGTIHSGLIGVVIEGKYDKYPVSSIAKNIDYNTLKYNN